MLLVLIYYSEAVLAGVLRFVRVLHFPPASGVPSFRRGINPKKRWSISCFGRVVFRMVFCHLIIRVLSTLAPGPTLFLISSLRYYVATSGFSPFSPGLNSVASSGRVTSLLLLFFFFLLLYL